MADRTLDALLRAEWRAEQLYRRMQRAVAEARAAQAEVERLRDERREAEATERDRLLGEARRHLGPDVRESGS